jgi:hypothetical protein
MKAYFARFRMVAVNKPKISSLSQEFCFLILVLCMASFAAGLFLDHILFCKPTNSDLRSLVESLAAFGMVLLVWLATQFQWPERITFLLRVASFLAAIAVGILSTWNLCMHFEH